MADDQTPLEEAVLRAVDQALDVFVYAPLGLALIARDHLPDLVARGRKQVEQQTTLAKMMGEYAVREAEKEVRRRTARPETSAPAPRVATATTAAANANGTAAVPYDDVTWPAMPDPEPAAEPVVEPAPSSEHLAIPGYDTLSASQVVQRLPGLSPSELEAVRTYEAATRGRRTILTKASQLQTEA